MIAYKLFRQRKDGTLGSLFIGARARLPLDKWMSSECLPTKGFAVREGWHCCFTPNAPHLSTKGRVWAKVDIKEYDTLERPESQGGAWALAKQMKILEIIT